MTKTYLIILFLLISHFGYSQNTEAEIIENEHFWWSVNSTLRTGDRWGVVADIHIRRTNFMANPSFYFARLGGAYWIADNLTLVAGIANLQLAVPGEDDYNFSNENRIYQQLQWNQKIKRTSFLQRIRTEQRWREALNYDGSLNHVFFNFRLRYLLSVKIPIWKERPYHPVPVISDEVLIQFGQNIVYNTFDQNRLFLGVSQRLTRYLSFDIGYMMVYQQKFTGYQYDLNHTFRFFFYLTPDLRKRKSDKFPLLIIPGDE